MKIYLVRHGQSEANLKNLFYGMTDSPLTELGRKQAGQVRDKLKNIRVQKMYVSPLQRARETGKIVAEGLHIPTYVEESIHEQNIGEMEMTTYAQVRARFPEEAARYTYGWAPFRFPGGESSYDVVERVRPFTERLKKENEDVLIAAHCGCMKAMLVNLMGIPKEQMDAFEFEQGCYSMVEVHGDFAALRCFNK